MQQAGEAQDESRSTSPSPPAAGPSAQGSGTQRYTVHKRRRVTRACDECRRKKIKCDGKQPCTHCTVFTYGMLHTNCVFVLADPVSQDCTFDQPSTRRRNPGPQYVDGLESRLQKAEALLALIIPNLDLNDPAIDVAVKQGFIPGLKGNMSDLVKARQQRPDVKVSNENTTSDIEGAVKDTSIESMVRAVGQIDLDEHGKWDYHGHSSGLSFVRQIREQLGDIMGPQTVSTPFVKCHPATHTIRSSTLAGDVDSDTGAQDKPVPLPSLEFARPLCENAINEIAVLLRVVHCPTFWASFDRIYSRSRVQYTEEDHRFLPLLYSVLAVGTVFGNDSEIDYESTIASATQFFRSARLLMDITDSRDLTAVQTLVFMIMFLQSSAKLSACYAYVGLALRSALRMGLHRDFASSFNPLEAELRKRVFWTIRKLDIYVGAMLGLPQTLAEEDIDQDFPLEIDDEYISTSGITAMPKDTLSLMVAFNAHTRLTLLLTKIVRSVYPIRPKGGSGDSGKTYGVAFSVIRDIENDLENWKSQLPKELSTTYNEPRLARAQQMLRLAYGFAQTLLYRPFLHFVGKAKREAQADPRAYACASSCVNVAQNIIHQCMSLNQKGLIHSAFWFIMYMTYFSIMTLVYFAVEDAGNPNTEALVKDALQARAIIAGFAKRSMAADRCAATLDSVFSRLPDWIREGKPPPQASQMRRQEGINKAARNANDNVVAGPPRTVSDLMHCNDTSMSSMMPSSSHAMPNYPPASVANTQYSEHQQHGPSISAYHPHQLSTQNLQHATMLLDPHLTPAGYQDMSSIMFQGIREPFGYPAQPLTTFENRQFKEQSDARDMSNRSAMAYSAYPGGPISAGSIGPYGHAMISRQGFTGASPTENLHRVQPHGAVSYNEQMQQQLQASYLGPGQQFPDVNLNDVFGSEWNGVLMNQAYQQ